MSVTIPILAVTAPLGITTLPVFDVPVGLTHFRLVLSSIDFDLLPPSSFVTIKTEISQDGGVTWGGEASGTHVGNGGPATGEDAGLFIIETDLFNPTPGNTNRKLRVTITAGGLVPISTSGGSLVLS